MATSKFTEGVNQTDIYEHMHCVAVLTEGMYVHWVTFISVLNSFLSITAFLGNGLILVALLKETSLHPPSKLLFRCLATTDLCVGLIAQPLGVIRWVSMVNEDWNLCRDSYALYFIAGYIFSLVSLLTLTAVSVDRLLAVLLGLRYRQVVTLRRTYMIVISFWLGSAAASASYLINRLITFWSGNIMISLCLLTSIICYTKIFLTLRHHQTQADDPVQQEQLNQTTSVNAARYRKAVSSALWLQLTLVACYLPYGIMSAVFSKRRLSSSSFLAWQFTVTLVYLNSTLNPFLYCWKISEVKQAVKQTIRQLLCCLLDRFTFE